MLVRKAVDLGTVRHVLVSSPKRCSQMSVGMLYLQEEKQKEKEAEIEARSKARGKSGLELAQRPGVSQV